MALDEAAPWGEGGSEGGGDLGMRVDVEMKVKNRRKVWIWLCVSITKGRGRNGFYSMIRHCPW